MEEHAMTRMVVRASLIPRRRWTLVTSAVLILGLGSIAGAAVTTISDSFADGGGGVGRDNGDLLNGVTSEVGAAVWEASTATGFVQPGGTITNLVELTGTPYLPLSGFVPLDGSAFPIGTTYSAQADFKFRQDPAETPVRFVEVGFTDAGSTGLGAGSLGVRVYSAGTIQVVVDGNSEANQNHANYNDPIPGNGSTNLVTDGILDIDAVNTIRVTYYEALNAVSININGNELFQPWLNIPQFMPTIGKAGFKTASTVTGGANVPVGQVTVDNFSVTADDAEQVTVIDGPVTWGGHTYYLLSSAAWAPSQAAAKALGGNLITINNQSENDFVFNQWGNYSFGTHTCPNPATGNCCRYDFLGDGIVDGLWLGYYQPEPVDPADEPAGAWTWVGDVSSYSNFGGSNPNDSNSCELLDLDGTNNNGLGANVAVMAAAPIWAAQGLSNPGEWVDFGSVDSVAVFGVVEVDGTLDNGFNTNWLYCRHHDLGTIEAYDNVTGEHKKVLVPGSGINWYSLTFSGTGNNDARLFVCRQDLNDDGDVLIAELDADGATVNSTTLKAIYAASSQPYPSDHINVGAWSIRYSQYHGTLFLCVNPDRSNGGQATVHEINLALDTVLNSYQAGAVGATDIVHMDINGHNGDVYVAHGTLVGANGGVVKIDTVTSPGTVTTLIDGATAEGGNWSLGVGGLIYRNNNNPENAQTLIVVRGSNKAYNGQYAEEYYLDQQDTAGNLLIRDAEAFWSIRWPGPGQLDEYSGTVISCRQVYSSNGKNAGINQYTAEDQEYRPELVVGLNDEFLHRGSYDVDSPGFQAMGVNPISDQAALAYVGEAATPSSIDYAVRNKGYDSDVNYSVAEDIDVSWLSLSKSSGGPIVPADVDTVSANIDTTGLAAGIYTATLVFTDTDNPSSVFFRTITLEVKECGWEVSPQSTQEAVVTGDITVWGDCADPQSYDFTVTSLGGADISYTVEEVDGPDPATAVPTDYAWLDLNKTSGGPIAAGNSDAVTVTITSDNTSKTAYLRFTPSCGSNSIGADTVIRTIEVTNFSETGSEKGFKHAYLGDVNPLDPDSCGEGCTFVIHTDVGGNNLAIGTVVVDPEAQNSKAFTIQQNSGTDPAGRYGYRSYTTDATGTDIRNYVNARLGFTMVARLKVQYNLNAAGLIWAWSKSRTASTGYATPKAGYNVGWGGTGPAHPGKIREYQLLALDVADRTTEVLTTETGTYHIIRMVNGFGAYGNRTLKIYFDEDPTPVLSLENTVPTDTGTGNDSFCFGTFGASAAADVWFDWISFTNKGMYAPGEEDDCIGSLIPKFCNDPFADADGDGDVDQDDFAVFQTCFTGSGGGVPEGCNCFDKDPLGGDGDIDSLDFGVFENCASGPAIPADPGCDD